MPRSHDRNFLLLSSSASASGRLLECAPSPGCHNTKHILLYGVYALLHHKESRKKSLTAQFVTRWLLQTSISPIFNNPYHSWMFHPILDSPSASEVCAPSSHNKERDAEMPIYLARPHTRLDSPPLQICK